MINQMKFVLTDDSTLLLHGVDSCGDAALRLFASAGNQLQVSTDIIQRYPYMCHVPVFGDIQ